MVESSSRNGDILDRLRGEYLERHSEEHREVSRGDVLRNKCLSRGSRERREEAYHVLSEIRSMNLQAEMFHQRQVSLQMNLKIELNALTSQLKIQHPSPSVGKTTSTVVC